VEDDSMESLADESEPCITSWALNARQSLFEISISLSSTSSSSSSFRKILMDLLDDPR
jgi:hypothetical protein